MSELDHLIPPEILNDELYQIIQKLAREEELQHVLEIGSSAGGGSTQAFVEGLAHNPHQPRLYCLEVSVPRFQALHERYRSTPFVNCYHCSSVPASSFPSEGKIADFYQQVPSDLNNYPLDTVLGWLRQDLEYLERLDVPHNGIQHIKTLQGITHFDMVLIDGSEFTGEAELEEVYGARYILLDDTRGFKNLNNYQRLKSDAHYELVVENQTLRHGYAVFRRKKSLHSTPEIPSMVQFQDISPADLTARFITSPSSITARHAMPLVSSTVRVEESLPIHFFTIVLNGMPFMQHHIEVFKTLDLPWHWHIVEGLAELTHCTAWGVKDGANIPHKFHAQGRSIDGTSDYIDQLARDYPDHVSIYRKPLGQSWDGKVEMINAPISDIQSEALLWQLDSDELWTAEQVRNMRQLFTDNPTKTAAYVNCNYFIGPRKYISTLNTWATQPQDWMRVWRYEPSMKWLAHEPPTLIDSSGRNLAEIDPLTRDETMSHGLVYEHPSYVMEQQVEFKEKYYGYSDAVQRWRELQGTAGPVNPAHYLYWAADNGAIAEEWDYSKGQPIFERYLKPHATTSTTTAPTEKRVIVAADLAVDGADLTKVSSESAFHRAIHRVFAEVRPKRIIETGTYLGTGTTSIIASELRAQGISDAQFFTIEVNPDHYHQALHNLQSNGHFNVTPVHGLTVPRCLLPTLDAIHSQTVSNVEFDNLIVDHREHERAELYFNETNFDAADDMLGRCMDAFQNKPDFVLLDSAGHMGNIEFNYLLELLQDECYIALDDVYHVKHRRSYLQILSDPRFQLVEVSKEKFGFCIAKYKPLTPAGLNADTDPTVQRLMWIRIDSVGDAVLSMSMLPYVQLRFPNAKISVVCQEHLVELYEACPYVEDVVGVNTQACAASPELLNSTFEQLQSKKPEIVLSSIFTRENITEGLALNTLAPIVVGMRGDQSRLSPNLQGRTDQAYTHLIEDERPWQIELDRHVSFLQGLGFESPEIEPLVWTTPEDEQFAEEFYETHELNEVKVVALFGGAQAEHRRSQLLGEALRSSVDGTEYAVLALGSSEDYVLNQRNCDSCGLRAINLSGKTSLRQAYALLRRCAFALGTETSLAHFACTLKIPHVVLLGGGHFGRFMPYSPFTTAVCLPLECYHCNWNCSCKDFYCLKDIDATTVSAAIRDRLTRPGGDKSRVFVQQHSKSAATDPSYPAIVDIERFTEHLDLEIISIA